MAKKKIWSPLRAWVELIALLLGKALIIFLPRRAVLALSSFLGRCAYRIGGRASKTARANLDLVYGETKTKAEKEQILLQSYQNFSLMAVDLLWFSFNPHSRLEKWVHLDPKSENLREQGALVLQTGHFGNWEVTGKAACAKGTPLMSVAAPLD